MPIYDETWGQDDYAPRNSFYLRDLPRNHLLKLDGLPFSFTEYKAHQNIPCFVYERMLHHCVNQYAIDYWRNRHCYDGQYYLKTCLALNQHLGQRKKYFPEEFVSEPLSRPLPHPHEVL
jgi:hypothetical protein